MLKLLKRKELEIINQIEPLILGTPGVGIGYHPWDNLKLCECGGSPWIEGKNGGDFEDGERYRVICKKCEKHTKNGQIQEIKNEWNNL